MTACVNCARALQPAWKYCIFCGTRTAVAATAPRSRPLPGLAGSSGSASGGSRRASAPARTSVPAFSGSSTAQTPIVPVGAPAPLAAAPNVPPVSSEWPETMGERPSLRSALAATEVPTPTPPAAPVPAPDDEEALELQTAADVEADATAPSEADSAPRALSIAELAEAEPETEAEPEPEPETEAEPTAGSEPEPAPRRPRGPRRRPAASTGTVVDEAPIAQAASAEAPAAEPAAKKSAKKAPIQVFPDEDVAAELEPDDDLGTRVDRTGRVNILAVLALLLGVLASPLAALFGHVALSQLRASGERGVIPAWIAIVLGYLWLGFFLVLGITYLATNG